MMMPTLSTTFYFAAATGIISAYIGYRRDRNPALWFLVGFFFGMFGMLSLFLLPKWKKKEVAPANKTAPQSFLFGPIDKFWYYLDANHTQVGPMSHQALTKEWQKGAITTETFIWHEDLTEWQRLKEIVKTF